MSFREIRGFLLSSDIESDAQCITKRHILSLNNIVVPQTINHEWVLDYEGDEYELTDKYSINIPIQYDYYDENGEQKTHVGLYPSLKKGSEILSIYPKPSVDYKQYTITFRYI